MLKTTKLQSKAFRHGFAEGFGAPAAFFSEATIARTKRRNAPIDSAWKSVEKALNESFAKEVRRGEASRKFPGKQGQAA
jgi:hypothetical protein